MSKIRSQNFGFISDKLRYLFMLWQYRGTAGTFLIESIEIIRVNNQGFVIKIQIAIKIIETWY